MTGESLTLGGLVLLGGVVAGGLALACLGWISRRMTPRLSPPDGPLRADGTKPNWVSTTARPDDARHYVAPRRCDRNPLALLEAQLRRERCVVRRRIEEYLHATARSGLFGFVDDIELRYDAAAGLLHGRSASRVGLSDMGVNRRRLERLLASVGVPGG